MNHSVHNKLVSFIWSIADDCLRDVYVRGKYRDVILPMVVLRRLDTLLEPSKEAVLEEIRFQREEMDAIELDEAPLKEASGYVFYNTSEWTLTRVHNTASNNRQILLANFEEYLNGFSANVQEIIQRFDLKGKIRHMADKDVLLDVVEKFISLSEEDSAMKYFASSFSKKDSSLKRIKQWQSTLRNVVKDTNYEIEENSKSKERMYDAPMAGEW